ncbi:hypothetical protein HDU76_008704, partial [Blyttiomyces sp. JEL0837]
RRRRQTNTVLPNTPPDLSYNTPLSYGGVHCGTPVSKDFMNCFIEAYCSDPIVREYMPSEMKVLADTIYADLGSPVVTLENAWNIFHVVRDEILRVGGQ